MRQQIYHVTVKSGRDKEVWTVRAKSREHAKRKVQKDFNSMNNARSSVSHSREISKAQRKKEKRYTWRSAMSSDE